VFVKKKEERRRMEFHSPFLKKKEERSNTRECKREKKKRGRARDIGRFAPVESSGERKKIA